MPRRGGDTIPLNENDVGYAAWRDDEQVTHQSGRTRTHVTFITDQDSRSYRAPRYSHSRRAHGRSQSDQHASHPYSRAENEVPLDTLAADMLDMIPDNYNYDMDVDPGPIGQKTAVSNLSALFSRS